MKLHPLFAVLGVVAGCSVDAKEPSAPAFDGDAPEIHILSPARGTIAGDVTYLVVTGTASDDSGSIASVTVNGVAATLAADLTWSVAVPVTPGTNLLHAIATDARHNQGTQTRAVVVGPMVALDRDIAGGIQTILSAQALSTLGRDAAAFIESGGLMSAVQGMNPVVDIGSGPNCLYAQASITSLTVGNADVQTLSTHGGISVSAVLDEVRIGMRLQWAVSCADVSRDVVLSAQRVSVQGLLAIRAVDRKLDIQFDHPDVQVTGFDAQLPDVPNEIVQMLALDNVVSLSLGLVTERVVVPMVDRSLVGLVEHETVDAAGLLVDVDVAPTQIDFNPEGATLTLATSLRAHGDRGQFVFLHDAVPAFGTNQGFSIAVADDALNQLLTSMWSAGAFDRTLDVAHASYGKLGDHYDSVQLQLAAPPHVVATGSPLELTIGDWLATFERDGVVAATVAFHARSALYVVEREDGRLQMEVSTPGVDVDIVDDHGNAITKAQYEAIRSFARDRMRTLGSAAVGAIPLPLLGDAVPTNVWLDPREGYLILDGNVQ